jgi:hypothetical protein
MPTIKVAKANAHCVVVDILPTLVALATAKTNHAYKEENLDLRAVAPKHKVRSMLLQQGKHDPQLVGGSGAKRLRKGMTRDRKVEVACNN